MSRHKSIARTIRILVATILTTLAARETTLAQSTLFNIPSTDVISHKKTYLEFDFISHPESHASGGFQVYAPRVVFGVGNNVEVGLNLSVLDSLKPDQPVLISPNVKWQFYNDERTGVAVAAGGLLYTPIANRDEVDAHGFIYTVVSKSISAKYGARFTGGAYGLPGGKDGIGTKGGAIVGYEQKLSKRITFVADWFSGKNAFGYATPGFSFSLPKGSLLNVGYSIGNQGRGNNGLFVYYGTTF